jgi:hypothetical protein
MLFPWSSRRRSVIPTARVPVVCVRHGLDLAALRRFVADGRPDVDQLAVSLIAAGVCPACRYSASEVVVNAAALANKVACACCGTTWTTEETSWLADVGSGLRPVDEGTALPTGVTIDGEVWRIAPFDRTRVDAQILRAELVSTPNIGLGFDPRVADVIEDLIDGVEAAQRGEAIAEAEVYRSVTDGDLDAVTAELIESTALNALSEIHHLLDGTAGPTAPTEGFDDRESDI